MAAVGCLLRAECAAAGAGKVATLEHCLAVGGQERIRLQLLLETRGGRREELDVQVHFDCCS